MAFVDDTHQQVIGAINFCSSQKMNDARDTSALLSRASGVFEEIGRTRIFGA